MTDLVNRFVALCTSLLSVIVWIGINSTTAKASDVRSFTKNIISLNANSIYG